VASVSLARLHEEATLLVFTGEFDLSNAAAVARDLDQAVDDPAATSVIVDLSGVTFLDSKFLQAMAAGRRRAQTAGKQLYLVRPPPGLWKVFELMMLDELFESFATVKEAEAFANTARSDGHG
jgi:stage II sporulation protein AA (anti-sigma F factor antagonist)